VLLRPRGSQAAYDSALIVDDDLAEVDLCLQELKRAQFSILADVVQTAAEFSNRLREQPTTLFSLIPPCRMDGLQALSLLQQQEKRFRSFS